MTNRLAADMCGTDAVVGQGPAPLPGSPLAPELQNAIGDVQQQLGIIMVKARQSIRTRAMCIHPQLQPMGMKVLTLLAQGGPSQQVSLAHEVGTDKAVMSRTIKQLEALAFVTRSADPRDGRATLISITEEAAHRLNTSISANQQLMLRRMADWDVHEVQQLALMLARLSGGAG